MTEADLAKKMEGLSAAATQGEWKIHSAMLGHKGDIFSPTAKQVKDCHHIARFFADKPDKPPACDLQARGVVRDAIQQIEANTSLVAALVNAYRNGQLIVAQAGDVPGLAAKDAEIARLREALKPFAQKQTVAEALADPTPPTWVGLSIEDRIKVMGENKVRHDGEIIAARQALGDEA